MQNAMAQRLQNQERGKYKPDKKLCIDALQMHFPDLHLKRANRECGMAAHSDFLHCILARRPSVKSFANSVAILLLGEGFAFRFQCGIQFKAPKIAAEASLGS